MYNKTIIRFGFYDIQFQLITLTETSIILDITKTSSNNCLLVVLKLAGNQGCVKCF